MNWTSLQIASNTLILVGTILVAFGTFGHFYFGQKIEADKEKARQEEQRTQKTAAQIAAEQLRRKQILAKLRETYILSHDGISPELMSGVAPLPKEWVEQQLAKMGENWRQAQYY